MRELADARVLVVDDQPDRLTLFSRALRRGGCESIYTVSDPFQAASAYRALHPDMLLLDYRLPPIDGFYVLNEIWGNKAVEERKPVIMLTEGADEEVRVRALEMGVSDFLESPFDPVELMLRVRNVLHIHGLYQHVQQQVSALDLIVRQRTEELREANAELLERLFLASEFRDDGTGEHSRRVGVLAEGIARQLGLAEDICTCIRSAARLHDIGKLGVPDSILFKSASLSNEELSIVRSHPEVGGLILSECQHPVLAMAYEIAISHHERWDGTGYPYGLAKDQIPLTGRIVSVADAYDVITSVRPYRVARTHAEAIEEIQAERGAHFDPMVVDALFETFAAKKIGSVAA